MTQVIEKSRSWRTPVKWVAALAMTGGALAVGGCETPSALLNGGTSAAQIAQPAVATSTKRSVQFAPIIGAPSRVSKVLAERVMAASELQKIPVVKTPDGKGDFTVRGYIVAAPDTAGTKLSYIWDVTGADGKRAHRITGEEFVKGKPGKDPWAHVDNKVIQGIASKTATQLAAWVPAKTPAAGGSGHAGGATNVAGALVPGAAPAAISPAGSAKKPVGTALAPAKQPAAQHASLRSDTRTLAMIPPVSGAPGDGKTALANALRKTLTARGIQIASTASARTYTVKGNVVLSKPKDGKQDIRIEWLVLDPAGARVGTVAQKNKIPAGSLNGTWGRSAVLAANDAAKGVIELLPKSKTIN